MLYGPVSITLFRSAAASLIGVEKIRDTDSALTVAQLLFLEAEETSKPIHLYINSPGGSVTAGLAIYDTVSSVLLRSFLIVNDLSTDAIRLVTHSYLLCRTSVLNGVLVARGRGEGKAACTPTLQHHDPPYVPSPSRSDRC